MKLTYLDYYILCGIGKCGGDICDIVSSSCEYLPDIPCREALEVSFGKLISSGYAENRDGKLLPSGKARDLLKDKKFLESKKKCECRRMSILCNTDTEASTFDISENMYSDIVERARSVYEIRPCLSLEGSILHINGEASGNSDDCVSAPSFSCEMTAPETFAKNLLFICDELTRPSKARKITLEAPDASYILTLSQERDGLVLKAQRILFNRKRFSGKTNGDLDYAQCGDTQLFASCPTADFFACAALIALKYEKDFTADDYQKLMNIAI